MADRGRRIVIEYDGRQWHRDAAHDHRKTQRLIDAGWTVIRVREAPLALLDPVLDVQVEVSTTTYGPMIGTVLNHLQALIQNGLLPDDGLSAKVHAALQAPVDEAAFYGILAAGFASYDEASTWAQQQGITLHCIWVDRTKRDDFPDNIPVCPQRTYKAEWQGWGVFLGTGAVANKNKRFRSYADASAWAQQQTIVSQTDWKARTKRSDFPRDIPTKPFRTYDAEWQDWGTFLGTGRKPGGQPKARPHVATYVINLVKTTDPENDAAFVLHVSA
nr:DUF559 domain-containing protein [Burkholderia cenocepacia]